MIRRLTHLMRRGLPLTLAVLLLAPVAPAVADEEAGYYTAGGLLNRGLDDLAAAEYERFLREQPDHRLAADARYGLGVALFRLGRYERVIEVLEAEPPAADFPRHVERATMLGQAHLILGRPKQAADVLTPVLRQQPKHELADDVAALVAEAQYHARNPPAVEDACRWLAQQTPTSPHRDRAEHFAALVVMGAGDDAQAAARWADLRKRYPKSPLDGDRRIMLAQCLHRIDDAGTPAAYEVVLEQGPAVHKAAALHGLATWHHQHGALDRALEGLRSFLRTFTNHALAPDARHQMANVLFAREDWSEADAAFRAAAQDPGADAAELAFWRAKCALRQDEPDRAVRLLRRHGTADGPRAAEIAYDLGVALLRTGDTEAAAEQLTAFADRFPDHPLCADALYTAATTQQAAGDLDASLALADRFLASFPEDARAPTLAVLVADGAGRAGNDDDAIARYRAIIERGTDPQATADAEVRLGLLLARAGRYDDAIPLLERAAARPDTVAAVPSALFALGDAHLQRSAWSEAAARLAAYVALDNGDTDGPPALPALDDALLKLGVAHLRGGAPDAAVAPLTHLVERFAASPFVPTARFELGQAYLELGQDDAAAAAFEALLTGRTDDALRRAAALRLGALERRRDRPDRAAELFALAAEGAEGSDAADALARRAESLFAAGDLAGAAEAYERLLEAHPDHPRAADAEAWRALARARTAGPELALADLERVLAGPIAPELIGALHYERAWCLRRLDRADEAIDAYGAVLEHPGTRTPIDAARWERARLLADAGRHAEALADLGAAPVGPEQAEAHAYRTARSLHALGRDKDALDALAPLLAGADAGPLTVPAAVLAGECHRRAGAQVAALPHFERAWTDDCAPDVQRAAGLRLGECQLALQRWAAAERTFRQWLERWADDELWFQARFGLAQAVEGQGRHAAARGLYEQVVAKHRGPTAARARFQIGECFFAEGKHEEAIRAFVQTDALHAVPEWSAAALYEASRCLMALGRNDEAKRQLTEVTERFPQASWAQLAQARLRELAATPPPGTPGRAAPERTSAPEGVRP